MPVNPPGASDLDADLQELARSIRSIVGSLKRGPAPPAMFHEPFENGSLGPRHSPVLMTVAFEGELSVSEIAERLDLSLSTTSLLVGELSRAGLIVRTEDERDRRRTLVRMADGYREAADSWLHTRLTPLRRTLERLSPAARGGFLEGCRILSEEIASLADAGQEEC
jgi:DNA-binding MarR family transcriptional regulator